MDLFWETQSTHPTPFISNLKRKKEKKFNNVLNINDIERPLTSAKIPYLQIREFSD